MSYPTYKEWLAKLSTEQQQRVNNLSEKFRAFGDVRDLENRVRSEVSEDIPQLARYLILKDIWSEHIDFWLRTADEWTEQSVRSASSDPTGYFAEGGRTIAKMLTAGVTSTDIGHLARMVAYNTAFNILNLVDEGYVGDGAPGWMLVETDNEGLSTGRHVGGLHEEILSMDPTGREGQSG